MKKSFPERCACGFEPEHPLVQPRLHFSPPKWILLCLGATPFPSRVDTVCTRCQTVLGSTKDKAVLEKF